MCVTQCPPGYYGSVNITGNTKTCLNCAAGCILCTDGSVCQAWTNVPAYVPNMWNDKLEFWILLIIVVSAAIIFAAYKIIKWSIDSKEKELE